MGQVIEAFPSPNDDNKKSTPMQALDANIEAVWRESGYDDPRHIVDLVLKRVPAEVIHAAIPDMVYNEVRKWLQLHRTPDRIFANPARPSTTRTIRSGKWGDIIDVQTAQLLSESSHYVAGTWKALGRLTVEDAQWMATYYRKLANSHDIQAVKFERLVAAMNKYKVEEVGNLPESVIREIFGL